MASMATTDAAPAPWSPGFPHPPGIDHFLGAVGLAAAQEAVQRMRDGVDSRVHVVDPALAGEREDGIEGHDGV